MLFSIATPFIKRPVLTTVCTLIIMIIGGISLPLLPISKLPQIAPTKISVTAFYNGADAKTAEETVTTLLEREINGVEDMTYMSSNSSNDGSSNITLTFPTDVDRNIAQVNIQNKVAVVNPKLPDAVKQTGVTVKQASSSILLAYGFYSEKDEKGNYLYDDLFISNYIDLFVLDELKRVYGVGSATIIGERKYSMRIWLDPIKLTSRGLTSQDVISSIQEQNIQVGAGKLGQQPMNEEQRFEIALRTSGKIKSVKQAEDLVIKVTEEGTLIRVKDVARVELGAENYNITSFFNGNPGIIISIYQLPGANALESAKALNAKLDELRANFPAGLKADIAFDTTLFVEFAIEEVVISLLMAIALVILIIFLFLQDWRTTLIPAIAIPVSLIGAMAGLLVFGFELNQLTLFACVLASGLVVDDGIVVVEAISIKINQGMKPLQAALDAMNELGGAVIATSVVLLAVFIPVSFFPGSTGIVYKQFALTIVFAIIFSTINALTFSPSMSAILLRRQPPLRGFLGWFFEMFNKMFAWITTQYRRCVEFLVKIKVLIVGIFIAGLVSTVLIYQAVPSGFIPEEDQGYFLIIGQTPPGVSLNYTIEQTKEVDKIIAEFPEVETRFEGAGFGFEGNGSNQLVSFVKLKPWSERSGPEKSVFGVIARLNQRFQALKGITVRAVNAPPVDGMGSTGGFELQVQNRSGQPLENLIANTQNLIKKANELPEIGLAYTLFTTNTPQMEIDVDRNAAKSLNVDLNTIFNTIQTVFGSTYVNDFILGDKQYRVYVQADQDFRAKPQDIEGLYVRSKNNEMIPLGNLVKVHEFVYPPTISHYNVYPSIKVQGAPAQGYSSGQAIAAMEKLAKETLPLGFGYEWTGSALEEKSSGGSAPIIFGLGFVMVFLVLAAQYESYVDPTIIMLTVPLGVLGALSGIWFRANVLQVGSLWPVVNNNLYCQVALVMLIGLASKNSILIVEFANQSRQLGMSITKAAIFAAEQRFRPIMMTAVSSLVGFAPLVIATGAGAMSRWSLGTAVFSGMLISTFLSLLLTPILYIVIKEFEDGFLNPKKPKPPEKKQPPEPQLTLAENEGEIIPSLKTSTENE